MTRLSFIPAMFTKIASASRGDLDQYVVAGVHTPEGQASKARAWKVNADNTNGGEITIPSEGGKVDSVSCCILDDGGARFVVSQAESPGASGSTAIPFTYIVPGVFAARSDYRPAIDQPARNQANSCTNMIHANNASLAALDQRVAATEAAIAAIEGA